MIEGEEGALDWLFEGEDSERPPQGVEKDKKTEREEASKWSIHGNHGGRENAGKWSLSPVSPLLFIRDRLPKTEAWDVEVHSFPGTSIVDAYAVLKHRTKGSEVTEHMILSFGLNDRNKGGCSYA